MDIELRRLLVCPACKQPLRAKSTVMRGVLRCEPCGQIFAIVAGIPSLFIDSHPYPLSFLPPEDILPDPPKGAFSLSERRRTNGLQRALQYYGKARFLAALRATAKQSPVLRRRKLQQMHGESLSAQQKQLAYRHSRESYLRRFMEPAMQRRFWPDARCVAMAETVHDLRPDLLLDLATGPGGFIFKALPLLKRTLAIGLDISFESCRTVIAEAAYFGLPGRVAMVHGDGRLMPFIDSCFDCISGWTAAYHISRYEDAIRECGRVLKPGGRFVGTFHTEYPSHAPEYLTRAEEEEFVRCAHLPMNISEVCEVFGRQGFFVVSRTPIGNSHMIVAKKK